ncbi:MAG: preprotein translocase subunit SecA, partial [Candidatus Paceibacterota bacterium]
TQFFVSLEDDVIRIFGGDRIKALMERFKFPDDMPIENPIIGGSIEGAQSKIEGAHFDSRKHTLEYDDVLNKHREYIYRKRVEILKSKDEGVLKDEILGFIEKHGYSKEDYDKKEQELGVEEMRQVEKVMALRILDMLWIEHLENMESLRDSTNLRAYGQRDPLIEYKKESHILFERMNQNYENLLINNLLKAGPIVQQQKQTETEVVVGERKNQDENANKNEIGRNDPCPCGAKHPDGRPKKYKHCCGK